MHEIWCLVATRLTMSDHPHSLHGIDNDLAITLWWTNIAMENGHL